MKMNDYSACCGTCFNLIAKKSSVAAKFWLDICKFSCGRRVIKLAYKDHSMLLNYDITVKEFSPIRQLELMGFLVSIDTEQDVIIKVKSERSEEDGMFFCGGICE